MELGEALVFTHLFRRAIPKLVPAAGTTADQAFRAQLMVKRDGSLWSKVHAPRQGPAFFAAFGLFALIEQWAHDADYESTTVPSMTGLAALYDVFDVLGEEACYSMGALTMFNGMITDIVTANDPRAALEKARAESATA